MNCIKHTLITVCVIFLCLGITFNTFASEIIYDIYPYPTKLHIILQFNGNKNGVTNISVPSTIWGHDLKKQIKNVQILDKSINQRDLNTFLHKSNQIIRLSYDVVNVDIPRKDKYFYTQSEKEGFFFLHDFALIYPELNNQQNVILRYHSPKNKEVFFLSEEIKSGKQIITSLQELKGGFSVSGSDDTLQLVKLHNITVLAFNIGHNNFINLQQILKTIVESQKSFCNCQVKDNAFIFIGNKSDNLSYRGTLLTNNLMLFLIPDVIDDLKFKNLLAHENLHKLIGSRKLIRFDPKNEQDFKWFSEGFTDYFALKTNLEKNNITLKQYLSTYNKILERYFTSPYKSFTYDQLLKEYWQNAQIKQTIYDRGHIIAQELDLEIQRISNKTLKDVLCEILNLFQDDEKLMFSKNILIETIKSMTKHDLTLKINSLIDGDINLSNELPNIQIENAEPSIPQLFMIPQYISSNKCNCKTQILNDKPYPSK